MKIQSDPINRPQNLKSARVNKQAQGNFHLNTTTLSTPPQASTISSVNTISPLATIASTLSVEEREARKKAVKRGGAILDQLTQLKQDLLEGKTPSKATTDRLTHLLQEAREKFTDDELSDMMDAIETRAAVELAKRNLIDGTP